MVVSGVPGVRLLVCLTAKFLQENFILCVPIVHATGWSAGDIIGLVVGVFVGVGILCALLLGLFFCRRYKLLNILCHDRDVSYIG